MIFEGVFFTLLDRCQTLLAQSFVHGQVDHDHWSAAQVADVHAGHEVEHLQQDTVLTDERMDLVSEGGEVATISQNHFAGVQSRTHNSTVHVVTLSSEQQQLSGVVQFDFALIFQHGTQAFTQSRATWFTNHNNIMTGSTQTRSNQFDLSRLTNTIVAFDCYHVTQFNFRHCVSLIAWLRIKKKNRRSPQAPSWYCRRLSY
ncbi:hypothetical protein D3C80_1354780 [compost metagenome]